MKSTTILRSLTIAITILLSNYGFSFTPSLLNKGILSKDSSICLILKGKVTKTSISAGHTYTVQLVDNNFIVHSKTVKAGNKFEFKLKKDQWYAVKIIKSGCVSKFISITTHNLPELTAEDVYVVNFDLADPISYDEVKYLDKDAADFPLAIISYDRTKDSFDYVEEYTRNIKSKLISTIAQEEELVSER